MLVVHVAREAVRYRMFDVASIDAVGARLIGPLLLEVGEEVTLHVARGDAEVTVRARVASVERGERDAVSVVRFVDGAEELAPLLKAS